MFISRKEYNRKLGCKSMSNYVRIGKVSSLKEKRGKEETNEG